MHKDGAVPSADIELAALARCVGDTDRFAREHWSRRPLLVRNPGQTSFDDLLDLAAVDHLLATTSLRLPAFRLVQDGSALPPSRYTKRIKQGGQQLTDVADVGRVHQLFEEGATIVLQGLQRYWLPLTRFCRSLEVALSHPVQANAYITPPDARGLGLHSDTHDVFLLQVLGSKHWEVHATGGRKGAEDGPVIDTDLEQGDTLYMPKGTPHAARTMKTASIHLTLGMLSTTWADLIGRVLMQARTDLRLGDALPLGFARGAGELAEDVADRLAALAGWLGQLDATDVADDMRVHFCGSRPPVLTGQLGQLLALDCIDDRSRLRRRAGALAALRTSGDVVEVVLGDRTLRLPAGAEPALRRILEADEVTADVLTDELDPASRLVLLRRLVREGLLEVVG